MYFYNKKDLSIFEKGNSLEWYLPNGLGGYSSSSAINSSFRKHNGYLVASLQSPVNRVLLLNKINETTPHQELTEGLMMFAASTAPSAAPAPIIV